MKGRGISDKFINDLNNNDGKLHNVLKAVLYDDTLCLEIRDGYINIYYRGGNLLRISETDRDYKFDFDIKYCNHKNVESIYKEKISDVSKSNDADEYVAVIPFLKAEMDLFFHDHPKLEREIQQHILRENNNTSKSKQTDYYIVDIEYANSDNGSRFDMLALKWPSTSSARKNSNGLGLSFIEVKYGDSALKGSAGISKHFQDIHSFLGTGTKFSDFIGEVETILAQKLKLGLMSGISESKEIKIDKNKLEFILLLANHDPDSTVLKQELRDVINSSFYAELSNKVDIRIARSSEMGYGLFDFKDNGHSTMLTLEEYLDEN